MAKRSAAMLNADSASMPAPTAWACYPKWDAPPRCPSGFKLGLAGYLDTWTRAVYSHRRATRQVVGGRHQTDGVRALMTQLSIIFAVMGLVRGEAVRETPPQKPGEGAPVAITVKDTKPAWLVYQEFDSPYWRVGPMLTQVRDYMAKHGRSGPMFIRYRKRPGGDAVGSLHCRLGFVTDDDRRPVAPFKILRRDPERVASLIIEGRSSATRRDHALIYEWLSAHGHEAAGPVTEIYDAVPRGHGTRPQRTEIQVSLRRGVDKGRPGGTGYDPHAVASSGGQSEGSTPRVPGPGTGAASADEDQPTAAEPAKPVRDLIAANRFDRIAEQLMPDDRAIPPGIQVWFGHVVFRVGAVANGVKAFGLGSEKVVAAVADALTRRYKLVSRDFTFDPLSEAVVRYDLESDPLARRREAIMRDLDRLLGRVALRTVDGDTVFDELADILQQLQDLLRHAATDALHTVPE